MPLPAKFSEVIANRCVMLGLARHSARWQYSIKKLNACGFTNIAVFMGADGYTNDISGAEWRIDPELRAGEIGFTLSCLKLWRMAANSGQPYTTIFEDDVLPHPDIATLGEQWLAETPQNFDIIMLGNQMNPADNSVLSGQRVILNCPFYCTHAYIISAEGAKKLMGIVDTIMACGGFIMKGDLFLKKLVEQGLINVACWNGKTVEKPYPVFDKTMGAIKCDTIVWKRDTGLFYQNFYLGTTLHGPNISYVYYD